MDIRRRRQTAADICPPSWGEELDKWVFVRGKSTMGPLMLMEFHSRGGSAHVTPSSEGKPTPARSQPWTAFDGCGKHITDRKRRTNAPIPYPHFQAPFSYAKRNMRTSFTGDCKTSRLEWQRRCWRQAGVPADRNSQKQAMIGTFIAPLEVCVFAFFRVFECGRLVELYL